MVLRGLELIQIEILKSYQGIEFLIHNLMNIMHDYEHIVLLDYKKINYYFKNINN